MTAGTADEASSLRSWALLVGVFAATGWVVHTIDKLGHDIMQFIQRWAQEPFESGVRYGIRRGREERIGEEMKN